MTENSRDVELRATMDASGVRAGVEQTKTALGDLSRTAEREGAKAGAGIEKAGDGAEKAAAKIDRETRSMVGSIERATAAFKAGERGTSGYFEALAKQRGISGDALKPYLDQLRQAEAAQKAATSSLGAMGVSAGQTAAALRQVPAQFTDIITSLQAGQAPLTVLLQQGGQLKDAFGGAGAAARALGSYVLGLVNPFTVAAAAVAGLGFAYFKGAEEAQAFQKTLILTGNVAGVTAQQLSGIAASIAGSGVTQGAAAEALNLLAATGKVGADNLGRFAAAAVQLQRVGGPAVEETAKAFAELGKDPLKASIKLDESTNFLTASVYKQIKALEEQGRATEAARVAQEAYAAVIEDRFPKLEKNLGSLERLWLNIKDATSAAASAAKQIGRDDTIDSLEAKIAQAQRRRDILATGGAADKSRAELLTEELRIMEQQLSTLKAQEGPAKAKAAASAQEAKDKAALQEFDKQSLQYLSKSAQMERELTAARNQYQGLVERGLVSVQQYRDVLAGIRDKARDKGADNAAQRALEQEAALLERLSGLSGTYAKDLKTLKVLRDGTAAGEERYVEAVKELIAKQPFAVKLEKEQADAAKQVADAMSRGNELYLKKIDALNQSADAVGKQVQKLRDEEEALGVSAALNISLAQAIEVVTIKRLDEQRAKALSANDKGTADAIQREIDARKELATLIGDKEGRDAAKKAADEAAKEWKRASDDIERTITDALMRGFESGKGFAQTLRDTLVNTFKTLILRPTIQAAVQPVANSLTGSLGSLLGLPSLGGSSGGAGGGGMFGGLAGLGGAGSALGSFGSAFSGGWNLAGSGFGTGLDAISGGWTALVEGSGTLAGNIGQMLGAGSQMLGTIGGYVSAFKSLTDGKYGAAAGSAIGTYFGGPIGAAIGNAIGSAVDKVFSGGAGTPHMGADYISTATGGYRPSANEVGIFSAGASVNQYRSQSVEDALKVLTGTGAGLLNSLATAFGKQANYAVGGYFAADGRDPAQANTRITAGGQTISSTATRYGVSGAKEGLDAFTAELAGQVRAALASMEIPEWAKTQLDGLANSAGFEELANAVQSITATSAALKQLGEVMPQLSGLTGAAVDGLLKALGGIDNLRAAASSYYDNFYTDAEKSARATQQLGAAFSSLGLSVPATREAFRALVEAQDLNTESGRAAYAELLRLSPAFAALVPVTQQLGEVADNSAAAIQEAAAKMAEAGRKVLADLADQQAGLQVELLRAQGELVAAAELERRNALAKITGGLTAQDAAAAAAAYDLNAALRDQIDALQAAASAAQQAAAAAQAQAAAEAQRVAAIEQQRSGLQDQLDQLTLTNTQLLAKQRAALDESNRALFDQIQAATASKAAQEAANQAAQAAAQALQQQAQAEAQRVAAIAGERSGLEDQLMRLLGETAGIRGKELAATDASNRALLERIYALQDEQAAAAAAAQAARELEAAQKSAAEAEARRVQGIASEREGLVARLLQAQGDSAALRERELNAIDASNRDLLERIFALEDEKAAQAAAAQAAAEAARVAEQLRQAWQSVADGIYGEVARIRNLMGGSGQQTLATAQAQFAISTAQARAGDQDAAKLLPGLSQTLLALAEANAGSLLDLQRIRAQIAASLEQTGAGLVGRYGLSLPKFDVGTNYVPRDMAAIVHEGEAIVPRAYNPAASGGGSGAVVSELRALRDENKAQALALVRLQTEVARVFKRWDGDGLPKERIEA